MLPNVLNILIGVEWKTSSYEAASCDPMTSIIIVQPKMSTSEHSSPPRYSTTTSHAVTFCEQYALPTEIQVQQFFYDMHHVLFR